MTLDEVEVLDTALGRPDGSMLSSELQALVDVAIDVRNALSEMRLSADDRDAIFASVLELTSARRRLLARLSRRAPALVGGGLLTAGAVAAIMVAVSRGRRHSQLPVPA